MATLQDIATEVIRKVHQVAGSSVQLYSEELVEGFVNDAFDIIFKKIFYPGYTHYAQLTIDGTTGKPTTNLATDPEVMSFDDIQYVLPEDRNKPLPILPAMFNPYTIGGNVSQYIEALTVADSDYATKLFRVWPLTATDSVVVRYRKKPKPTFVPTDEIYMDKVMLVYASVWQYMKDDGTIPEMTDEYRNLFNDRYEAITNGFRAQGVEYRDGVNYGGGYHEQSEWYTMP
jgi:hypothetical protein